MISDAIWRDMVAVIFGIILIVIGLIGCVVPGIAGPPISYIALLLLQWSKHPFSNEFMWVMLFVVLAVTVLDNLFSVFSTRLTGGSKAGTWGAAIGLIAGFFFGATGVILGPFVGALLGELINGKRSDVAFKSAFGAFLGILFGTVLKLITSGYLTYQFFKVAF